MATEPSTTHPEDRAANGSEPSAPLHRAHTYQDDIAKAMNATDARTVQEMLATARAREVAQKEYEKSVHERAWYRFFSVLFVLLAVASFGYGVYHYSRLTVPVTQQVSVGVFPNTAPVAVPSTDIRKLISSLETLTPSTIGKPALIPLVVDDTTLSPVSKESFFSFIEASPSEPFVAAIDVIRLGTIQTVTGATPFVILAARDPQVIAKEFLIAEPNLLTLFYKALAIDISAHRTEIGKEFESTYLYNMPVRTLSTTVESGEKKTSLLYGFVAEKVVVLTTSGETLKAIYDTIMKQ